MKPQNHVRKGHDWVPQAHPKMKFNNFSTTLVSVLAQKAMANKMFRKRNLLSLLI